MDRPDVDPAQLATSLADLRAVNRWLGGRRSAVRLVLHVMTSIDERPVRILDVGTGGADLPIALAHAARARGREVEIYATDPHSATLAEAASAARDHPEIRVVAADAHCLPWPDGAFHIATAFTMLHHFSRDDAIACLRELARVASRAIVVTDLARSRPAWWGARALARTVWRGHPVTRHDGPISVRGAFTPAEILGMAREAGLEEITVRREPIFRLALTAAGAGRFREEVGRDG